MTKDRVRKKAIRARMAASGEPYSVAARNVYSPAPADDAAASAEATAAAGEIVACAVRTWAAPSARMESRHDFDVSRPAQHGSRGRGGAARPLGRLARRVGKAVWDRVSDGAEFGHGRAEGFLEPIRGRYMIDFGSYAVLSAGGETFDGRVGRSLRTLPPAQHEGTELWLLRLLSGATGALPEGVETLRGTSCRRYAVQVELSRAEAADGAELRAPPDIGPRLSPVLALAVWTDGQHIRRVRFEDRGQDRRPEGGLSVVKVLTLELWEFGVPVHDLDWSRLPDFRRQAGQGRR